MARSRGALAEDLDRLIEVLEQGLATPEHAAFVAKLAEAGAAAPAWRSNRLSEAIGRVWAYSSQFRVVLQDLRLPPEASSGPGAWPRRRGPRGYRRFRAASTPESPSSAVRRKASQVAGLTRSLTRRIAEVEQFMVEGVLELAFQVGLGFGRFGDRIDRSEFWLGSLRRAARNRSRRAGSRS